MAWTVSFEPRAFKELGQLDRTLQRRMVSFLQRLQDADDPRKTGKPLRGEMRGLWRYRVGEYRIVCSLDDQALSVMVVRVGHRKSVYR